MRTFLVYTDSRDAQRETLRIEVGDYFGPVPAVGRSITIEERRYTVRAVDWDVYTDPGPHNPAPSANYPQQCITVVLGKPAKRRRRRG